MKCIQNTPAHPFRKTSPAHFPPAFARAFIRGVQAVKKKFGRFSRNDSGEIQVSLEEVQGELHLDLRIYSRPARDGDGPRSEPESIAVPVRMVRDLCEILEQTQEDLAKEGLVDVPTPDTVITTEAPKPVFVLPGEQPKAEQPGSQPDRNPESLVHVSLPVECRLLSAPKSWPSKLVTEPVTGETRDLSPGGAQVWLPQQFPIGTHLAVFIKTGELTFRAQAEVKGVASDPEHGNFRHNLKWMLLDPQARTALLQIMEAAGHVAQPQT